MKICCIKGCERKAAARSFCHAHLWRIRKFGDPTAIGPVKHANRGGISKHPLYSTWNGMISRCYNPKQESYAGYGARGIYVCDRWRDFVNFLADMGERPAGMTLDRIDPKGPYSPENCRWASPKDQRANYSEDGKRRQREGARAGAIRKWKRLRQHSASADQPSALWNDCQDLIGDTPGKDRKLFRGTEVSKIT